MGRDREYSQRLHLRLDRQSPVLRDLQIARDVHHRFGGNRVALGVVEINSGTARLGGRIQEDHLGGDAGPIGEMRKIQSRLLVSASRRVHRHHRQRGEDAVGGIHLQGHGGEPSIAGRGAAHRPTEVRRVGRGERIFDEPGRLPVGLQMNLHFFQRDPSAHQSAPHPQRFRFQVMKGRRRADSSRLAAHREEGVAGGLARPHPRRVRIDPVVAIVNHVEPVVGERDPFRAPIGRIQIEVGSRIALACGLVRIDLLVAKFINHIEPVVGERDPPWPIIVRIQIEVGSGIALPRGGVRVDLLV